jgi:microcystin-dependent protein
MSIILTNDSRDLLVNYKNFLPCGSIVNYAGSTAPNGWLICDGSNRSRSTYSALFDIIGTTYGTPDSSLNFKLPDLQDRVPVGKTSSTSLGDISGNNLITLTTNQMPSHFHTGTIDSSGGHTHTGTTDSSGAHTHTITDPGHTHSQTTINDDYNNSGNAPPGFSADSAGEKTWNNISTAYTGITVDSVGSHSHSLSINSAGTHSHRITIDSYGGSHPIDIRNRCIFLNYIIKY